MFNVGELVLGYVVAWGLFLALIALNHLFERFWWLVAAAGVPMFLWWAAATDPLLFAIPVVIVLIVVAVLVHDKRNQQFPWN
jgi:hypothetical protein